MKRAVCEGYRFCLERGPPSPPVPSPLLPTNGKLRSRYARCGARRPALQGCGFIDVSKWLDRTGRVRQRTATPDDLREKEKQTGGIAAGQSFLHSFRPLSGQRGSPCVPPRHSTPSSSFSPPRSSCRQPFSSPQPDAMPPGAGPSFFCCQLPSIGDDR